MVEQDKKDQIETKENETAQKADELIEILKQRLSKGKDTMLEYAKNTGASFNGAEPDFSGIFSDYDLFNALRLIVKYTTGFDVPIQNNGLGYNNLIFISLLLAKMQADTDGNYLGSSAKQFPILFIEEPEAHLHPSMQYKFLKFLKDNYKKYHRARQIFVTTHSTQITSAILLEEMICLHSDTPGTTTVCYPGRVFTDDDEGIKSKKFVQRFLDATKSDILKLAIRNARWRIDEHGEIVCKPKHAMKANARGTFLSSKTYLAYKKQAWAKGLMHYDDVIYFAYRLFERIPFIQEVIARKFPFLFIDEFQDSHPIQVGLIKKLSERGSIIGVIGDPAQSIYQFLGADVTQFNTFTLPHLQEYVISGNRRSTIKIVDFLNSIRRDLQQVPHRTVQGEVPVLLVGSHIDNYQKVQEIVETDVYALSYDNLNANSLKKMMNANAQDKHLIDNIIDLNEERKTVVATYIKALEHAKAKKFKKAFDLLARLDVDIKDAVVKIHRLLSSYDDISKMSLYEFYDYLNITFGLSMATLKKGQAQTFYNSHQYSQLAMCVNHEDDDGIQRTIHKAKGDEFDNVMVCLGDEKALDFFLQPDLLNNESHRVYYVAASRAKERLFFSIPLLSNGIRKKIEKLGIEIK